jgi:hypothetical protein
MGAGGVGIFEDDAAMDFLAELNESKRPVPLMKAAFDEVPEAEYVEYDAGQRVLVSAALIDTILNGTRHAADLEEVDSFVKKHRTLDVSPLRALASTAIRRVLSEGSELRGLWEENAEDYSNWSKNLEALAMRLEGRP